MQGTSNGTNEAFHVVDGTAGLPLFTILENGKIGQGDKTPDAEFELDLPDYTSAAAELSRFISGAQNITLVEGIILSTWYQNKFLANTFSADGTGETSIDLAATLFIDNEPQIGSGNMSLNESYALYVQQGTTKLGGDLIIGSALSGSASPSLSISRASLSSNSEIVNIDSGSFTQTISSDITSASANKLNQIVYTAAGATRTVTNAATLYIASQPLTTGTAVITNPYALWIDSGTSRFDGSVGIGTTTPSKTLSVQGNALISGDLNVANLTATGTLSVGGTSSFTGLASFLSTGTTTFAGGLSAVGLSSTGGLTITGGGIKSSGNLEITSAATSSFSGGIATAGLSTSNGLTVSGGNIVSSGTLNITSVSTSTLAGGLSLTNLNSSTGILVTGGSINNTSSATSTWSGGLSLTSLLSSQGFTITGGTLINTSSATSTFTGGIATGGLSSANGLTISKGNIFSVGTLNLTTTSTSTLAGGISLTNLNSSTGITVTGGSITNTGSATSTFAGGISSVGLSSSAGLVVSAGSILNTSSATSTFSGGIVANSLLSSNGLIVSSGNVGIGHTTPGARLSVKGVGTGSSRTFELKNSSNSDILSILDNGTATLTGSLIVSGSIRSSATGFLYVSGASLTDASDNLYYSNGAILANSTGELYYGGGDVLLADSSGKVYGDGSSLTGIDHSTLSNLTVDSHTQYALLAGRSGGQSLTGGTAANDDITIQGTSNSTRATSYVNLQPNGGFVGVGTTSPAFNFSVQGNGLFSGNLSIAALTATSTISIGSMSGSNMLLNQDGAALTDLRWTTDARVRFSTNSGSSFGTAYEPSGGTGGIRIGQTTAGYSYIIGGANLLFNPVGGNGNVGIGTTTPDRKLTVSRGGVVMTSLANNSTGYYACVTTTSGELSTSTTACGASSIKYKENVLPITYGLDAVRQLNPVSFDWKQGFMPNATHQIGFIAEEVELVIPEIIGYGPDGEVMNLDYPKLTAVLTKAVQELNDRVEYLSSVASSTSNITGGGSSGNNSGSNNSPSIGSIVSAVMSQIVEFLNTTYDIIIERGLLKVAHLITDKVTTKELCIEDVCVTRDQFLMMVKKAGIKPIEPSEPVIVEPVESVESNGGGESQNSPITSGGGSNESGTSGSGGNSEPTPSQTGGEGNSTPSGGDEPSSPEPEQSNGNPEPGNSGGEGGGESSGPESQG